MPLNATSQKSTFSFAPIVVTLIALGLLLLGLSFLFTGVYHMLVYIAHFLWNPVVVSVLPAVTFVLMLGVIFLKQPVQNLLCLISIFFSAVTLYLYVGAEYLAFLFLIVYVGAIAILFLFVIMLLHIKKSEVPSNFRFAKVITPTVLSVSAICFGLNDFLSNAIDETILENESLLAVVEPSSIKALSWYIENQFSDILMLSDILYRANALLFFIISLLLLTAMLGAIVLATSATDRNDTSTLHSTKD